MKHLSRTKHCTDPAAKWRDCTFCFGGIMGPGVREIGKQVYFYILDENS